MLLPDNINRQTWITRGFVAFELKTKTQSRLAVEKGWESRPGRALLRCVEGAISGRFNGATEEEQPTFFDDFRKT